MEVKPGYKQTEVGVIPEDWEVISASDVCSKIQDGTHFSPRLGGSDYLYITSKNIRRGYLDISSAPRIDVAQHQAIYKRCDVKKGDLLLTKDGANTGNAALNTLDEEFSLLSSVAFLRFPPDKYNAAYFLQQILVSQGQRQIQDAMTGNAITRLTLEKIKQLRFPLPPTLAEQEAIAAALSDADALIEGLEQLIAKKRQVKQGAMQELLTGKRRLPGFGGDWEVKRLGEIGSLKKGRNIPKSQLAAEGRPCVLYGEIYTKYDCVVRELTSFIPEEIAQQSTVIKPGDILFAGSGETAEEIGKSFAYIGTEPAYAGGDLIILSPQEDDSIFLGYQLNSPIVCKQKSNLGQGVSVVHIYASGLATIEVPLPPLPEQTAIAAILSDMDAELAALEAKLVKARQVKQGMMQELLTGRIRLVRPNARNARH